MELEIIFTVIFLVFLIIAFLAWYFIYKSHEKERLLMIEKGLEIPRANARRNSSFGFPWLKMGILVTSVAIGLLIGLFISHITQSHVGFEPIMMLLFGGIGMIIAHYIDRKNND